MSLEVANFETILLSRLINLGITGDTFTSLVCSSLFRTQYSEVRPIVAKGNVRCSLASPFLKYRQV